MLSYARRPLLIPCWRCLMVISMRLSVPVHTYASLMLLAVREQGAGGDMDGDVRNLCLKAITDLAASVGTSLWLEDDFNPSDPAGRPSTGPGETRGGP